MPDYTPDQLKVIRTIRRVARNRYADPHTRKRYEATAFSIGRVETNFHNLGGGDADSAGWRQERASLYRNPTNIKASVNRVFDEMEQHDHGQKKGALAADVQRPREDLRGRYAQHMGEAKRLARGGSKPAPRPFGGAASLKGRITPGTRPTLTPGGEKTDTRGAMLAAVRDDRKGMGLLDRFRSAVESGGYTTITPSSVTAGKGPQFVQGKGGKMYAVAGGKAGGKVARATKRANAIDAQKLPYLWGGGHAGKTKLKQAQPLDCSGAVSKVLGINPRVSGQFEQWGKPGKGKITVYANSEHVLMSINGRFWGTSAANPGGGAGWIPSSQISPEYLSKFTARHA